MPVEIKITYLIAIAIMLLLVGFIIVTVLIHNKKQLLFLKEKQLKEAEFKNAILEEKLTQQKIIEAERMRISADMHDELGAGISAIKLQAEFIKQNFRDAQLETELNDLIDITKDINSAMREMLWSLNTENDTLANLFLYTVNYIESFFKKSTLTTHFSKILDHPETRISATSRRNIFLCIKECINNVYKHSGAKNIDMSFVMKENLLIIKLADDGIGFDQESVTSGNGLRTMQFRMQEVNGKYKIDKLSKGISTTFTIPLA
ncbi:MAG: two-component sensor histidine kinase [Sphingobacteriales bacterium]|nr:MAG: two-component sensor histidine kinase [Sphingobacteriales bacterium]